MTTSYLSHEFCSLMFGCIKLNSRLFFVFIVYRKYYLKNFVYSTYGVHQYMVKNQLFIPFLGRVYDYNSESFSFVHFQFKILKHSRPRWEWLHLGVEKQNNVYCLRKQLYIGVLIYRCRAVEELKESSSD